MIENDALKEIVDVAKTKEENEVCVSLYLSSPTTIETQLNEQLRPLITKVSQQNQHATNTGTLYNAIAEQLVETLSNQQSKADGYAVFFLLDKSLTASGKKGIALRYTKVIPLFCTPEKESYLGDVFNITQLLYLFKVQPSAFALDLTRERATLYLIDKHECTHIHTFETEVRPEGDAEYSEIQGATGIVQGTGQDKVERRHIEENKYLIHQVEEVLTEMQDQIQNVGNVIVAYTSKFSGIVDDFVEDVQKTVQPAKVFTLQKNVQDAQDLQNETEEILRESYSEATRQEYDEAAEAYARFSLDRDLVLNAVSQASVQTLFIKLNQSLSGYITDSVLFSKKSINEHSVFYENVLPYIVLRVFETDGTVIAFSETSQEAPLLAALFRYDKDQLADMGVKF